MKSRHSVVNRLRRTYHTLQELHASIFKYIEEFYNSRRPHSSLGLLTPNEKESIYWEQH
ncbi:MAG: transposase [Lachnospiraceae bacterium]|nr:transposase [Lachnospiraceae bacterium]